MTAAQADSLAKGFFGPRVTIGPNSQGVSVTNVTPGWFQGASQPRAIFVDFAGPVKSVTITGGTGSGDAIFCSGNYGRVKAFDAARQLLADVPLTLIDPSDCGLDMITFGAHATITSSSAEIAQIWIIPMSPLTFSVLGNPGGNAGATYLPTLTADPDPNQPPVAIASVVCYITNYSCTFDASQSTDDHGIVSYKWDVGAGPAGRLTGKVVTFTYPNAQTRPITLTVTDANGRSAVNLVSFYFNFVSGPGSNFAPTPVSVATCSNLTCTFDSSASTDDVGIVLRQWNFGDGTGAGGNEAIVRHTYPAPVVYNVTFLASDGGGAGSYDLHDVTVGAPTVDAPPTAAFAWTCSGQSLPHQCSFDASGSKDDVGIASYSWNWGNGRSETKTGSSARNTWAAPGTYSVSLTVTDTKGQTNVQQQVVVVP